MTTTTDAATVVRRLARALDDPREGQGEPGALPRRAATRAAVFGAWAAEEPAHTRPAAEDVRALAEEIGVALGATAWFRRDGWGGAYASEDEANESRESDDEPAAEQERCWGDHEAAPWAELADALEALADALEDDDE